MLSPPLLNVFLVPLYRKPSVPSAVPAFGVSGNFRVYLRMIFWIQPRRFDWRPFLLATVAIRAVSHTQRNLCPCFFLDGILTPFLASLLYHLEVKKRFHPKTSVFRASSEHAHSSSMLIYKARSRRDI